MSSISDIDLDLEKLFQPAWAQEKPATNRFDRFTGNEGVKPERRFNDKPGERRAQRRDNAGGGERRGGQPRGGSGFGDRKPGFSRGNDRRDDRSERRERPEPPPPLPEISVTFLPGENGVESLARQIKMTGRCYPLFQIAQLVLEKPERYSVHLAVKKKSDGTIAQPLFVCALDDTPWLSEDEAVAHVLKNHFATFYQAERTATEPPKGTYTFVAQCGLSGAILGPPNYHDYQNQLRKLHAERFSRMPFDVFKSRVKIVKDEAVVKKWIEEQSSKTEYVVLNVPEPLKLATLEEVEKHFRATHKETIIKSVESLVIAGVPSRTLRSRGLQQLIRAEWEQQKYFPLTVATRLSQQFASHGLQFFKVNKTVTHVAVARPQFLDLATTPVSESIKRIVEFINAHPKCTRRKMIETLAPSPTTIEVKPEEQKSAEPTPEQTAIIADLHWLVHQGHVLEFADGKLDTAKKPLPKPPKPEKKKEKPTSEVAATTETAPQTEVAIEPATETSILTEAEIPAPESAPVVEPVPAIEQPNQIASEPPIS
ncbi:MAG TPA: hypothetical protein VGM58_09255 [Verrucomicrobiae bacterium]|jgi:hypothetical protein